LTDVFQVQADIATQVAQALGVALGSTASTTLAARPTQNLAAYDSLLRGDELLITEGRLEREAAKQAAAAYGAAVRLDSTFGLAWGRLAWAESWMYDPERDDADSIATIAKEAADRALALAPDLAQTYTSIALVRSIIYRDGRAAIPLLRHARALAPHDIDVLTQLAVHLGQAADQWDEAIALCAEAARLDPRSPLVARRYAAVLVEAGRFRAADSVGSVALRTARDNIVLLYWVTEARIQQGDVSGARAVLHEASPYVPARRLVRWLVDYVWLMDDSLRAFALRLPPKGFGEGREGRALGLMYLAKIRWNEGRYEAARAGADSARPLLEQWLKERPADTGRMAKVAAAYAYVRRCADAVRMRERARAIDREGPTNVDLAFDRVDIGLRCGDYAEAVAWADTLIRLRRVTPAWLRVHPAFAPLRSRPDFERLVAGK
jgi:tetratricopeptide (TPR) repeat protein